jgi:hypothetical protein
MRRRDFLSTFLIGSSACFAQDGLLIDDPNPANGLLMDGHEVGDGLLIDIPKEVLESQKKIVVHLYSPTWACPPCDVAIKELKDHIGIKLVVHKDDEPPGYFKGKSFPILHWGEGDKWQSGWNGKEKFLAKLLGDDSSPPSKKTNQSISIKDSGGHHWSVSGDWQPTLQKTINHLVHVHGFQRERLANLNLGQALTLHDAVHEGRFSRAKHVSQYQQRTEDCPT